MITTAVILAAGMGTRLQDLGKSQPKGFLQLGEKPIIEESIARLIKSGIKRIIIVTGYQREFYDRLAEQYKVITTQFNPRYAESGSFYSLYCARNLIESDFLLLESDLIYEQQAITTVINFPKDNVILLSGKTNAGDEVYVETNKETIITMSKNPHNLQHITGEFVGICKISLSLFAEMLAEAKLRFQTTLKGDYETDGLVAVAKNYPVYYQLVPKLIWAEIDDYQHLIRAKELIYPAILASH
ncbi:MAG: phosphocholine cytidylyltransferase family protein [Oscillatoria sp. PMC 1051.18]|nr:phosphocholine cytidylyltransferase family protein [Oscillatoria sp. PMC 1050.18]MEC5032374.1 phosphocholine cytidylyltransferase family protein [Oscillatoria sp. PMC 1051.18]